MQFPDFTADSLGTTWPLQLQQTTQTEAEVGSVTEQFQHLLEESPESKETVLSHTERVKQRQDRLGPSIFAKIQEGDLEGLKLLAKFPEDFRLKDHEGNTLLGAALREGKSNIVSFLLEEDQKVRQNPATANLGIDVNVENKKGFTPLFQGYCFALNHNDDFEPLRLLLKREDLLVNQPVILGANEINHTILTCACLLGRKDLVEDVLKHPKVEINQPDIAGCTAILHAYQAQFSPYAVSAHKEIVQLLMQQEGIDLAAKIKGNMSFLFFAALHGDAEMVRTLVGKQVFNTDLEQLMLSQMAAQQNQYTQITDLLGSIIRLLLS